MRNSRVAGYGKIANVEVMVPVSGGEVWAADTGGNGPPLVLLHPGWGDSTIWDAVMDQLPSRYRVIRHDVRGYGKSPAPVSPYTQLTDLIAVLDYCAVTSAAIVGHSGGGGTAIGLALAAPERVSALILLAPGIPDYPWPPDDPFGQEFGPLFTKKDREGLAQLGLRTWAAAGPDPAARAQVYGAVDAFFRQGDFERPPPAAYDHLDRIQVPTLVVLGDREYPMVRDCGEQVAARIRGSRQVIIDGADHLLPLRAPGEIAKLVTQYVQ
jgi:pimeloyl-ACP methyl ester carboxylesterase